MPHLPVAARVLGVVVLGCQPVEYGGPFCDSLNAIADREDPIVKVDTSGAGACSAP